MRTKAIFDDIQSYSVLDFPSSKPPLNSKRKTNKSRKSATCPPSWKFQGKLNLLMNLNRVPLIVLGFFNFHFPIDFIGVQFTGGQCFLETPINRGKI